MGAGKQEISQIETIYPRAQIQIQTSFAILGFAVSLFFMLSRSATTENTRLRVFVVDDDTTVADTVSMLLRHAGFDVTTFYAAISATRHALESEPHVVVTDYSMPNMNGLALALWLRDNCPSCKIVILSGEAAVVAERAADDLKFTLLQKPVAPQALIAAIVDIDAESLSTAQMRLTSDCETPAGS